MYFHMCNLRFTYIQNHEQGSFKYADTAKSSFSLVSHFVSVSAYDPDGVDLLVTASDN